MKYPEICTTCGCPHQNTRPEFCKSCYEAMCKVTKDMNTIVIDTFFGRFYNLRGMKQYDGPIRGRY